MRSTPEVCAQTCTGTHRNMRVYVCVPLASVCTSTHVNMHAGIVVISEK